MSAQPARPSSLSAATGEPAELVIRGATRARPARRDRRRPRRRRPRRRDRRAGRARGGASPTGAEVVEAEGLLALPGLRRPARPPPHSRARSTRRTSRPGTRAAAAGGYCADGRDGQHRAAGRLGGRCRARCASAPSARPRSPVGFLATVTREMRGRRADRDGRAARRRRGRLLRRRACRSEAPGCCGGRCSISVSAAA